MQKTAASGVLVTSSVAAQAEQGKRHPRLQVVVISGGDIHSVRLKPLFAQKSIAANY